MIGNVINLPKSTVHIDDDGIVISAYKKDSMVEIDDVYLNRETTLKLTGGKSCVTLIHLSNVTSVSKEARYYFSSAEWAEIFKAIALYATTPVNKSIGNFFLGINKPVMPVKLFDSKEKAIEWLKEYLE